MSPGALAWLCSLLAALAALLGARVEAYDTAFAGALLAACLWRLLLGRDGRRLLPRRVLAALLATLLALGLLFLLDRGAAGAAAGLGALLGVLSSLLAVGLLGRIDAFGAFWVVLLSSVHAAAACYVGQDLAGLLLVPAYVGLLTATLVVLERRVAAERAREGGASVTVLHDPGSPVARPLAWRTGLLLAGGFSAGLALWLLLPRPAGPAPLDPRAPRGARADDALGPDLEAGPVGEGGLGTGPDEQAEGARMGDVGRIQEDRTVHLELRLTRGRAEETFLLREDALDLWSDGSAAATGWRSSGASAPGRTLRAGREGWIQRAEPEADRDLRAYTLRVRRPRLKLYLEPEVLALRVLRPVGEAAPGAAPDDLPLVAQTVGVLERRSGELRPASVLEAGVVVEALSMPQPRGGDALRGRRSGPGLAPLRSYTDIEPSLAARLRQVSAAVPGVRADDPWERAQALEAWLKGPTFTYELASPRLRPGERVLDFLTRVRRGNCEWFATSLVLLLRAHGLPARYVRGYWGGSHTAGSDLWTFYGAHYHGWAEVYLEGPGWVPLNPTPPERLAEGADPRTVAGTESGAEAAPEPSAAEAPGLALRRWAGGLAERVVVAPLRWSLSERGGYAGLWLALGLLALAVVRGRRRARARAAQAPPGRVARCLYLEGLRLLAREGLVRRRGTTARQFLREAGALLAAPAREALARLTAEHEAQRYAGAPEDRDAARAALRDLAAALG